MAVNDCTYVNSASTSINLNGSDYKLLHPGPQGIYNPIWRPSILPTPRKIPVGIYQEHLSGQREIILPLRVIGSSASDLITKLDTLWDALDVDCRDGELGTLTYTAPNSVVRSIKCALAEGVDPSEWYSAGLTDAASVRIELPLVCPDPTFYFATPVTPSSAFGADITITTPGFETGGTGGNFNGGTEADDGTSDTFTGWTASNNDGAGDKTEATTTAKTGTYALKLTYTAGAASVLQTVTVIPSESLTLSFWTRGDGTRAARYQIRDATNSVDIQATVTTGITDTTYTKVSQTFTVPAGCVSLTIRFYNPSAAGVAYIDTVRLVRTAPVVSCVNAGNADAYPTITITTDGVYGLANLSITDAYGKVLAFTATMAVSKVLVLTLDPQNLSMLYDTSTDWFPNRTSASQLILVKYGTNNLTFTTTTTDATAAIAVSFVSRYSKHG